jgi:hypothetical protein
MKAFYPAILATLICGTALASDYKVDSQIGKGQLGIISQLAVGANDTVYALENGGKIMAFKPDGSLAATLETGMKNTDAIAMAPSGHIYVFATLTEEKKVKVGARMRTIQIPIGVECGVFDATGKKLKSFTLDQLKSAKAARIVGGKLIVADLTERALVFHDLETGKEINRLTKGLRLCCGIFDFCEAPGNTVAVANLGAFSLQRYDLEGKLLQEFGQRGRELEDFQGCCNPVSAAYLPNGEILTVEKDPTRIKIYDANGKKARQIAGVEELVKGCSYIPVAVDSKGAIYLGAAEKGYIVKCIP